MCVFGMVAVVWATGFAVQAKESPKSPAQLSQRWSNSDIGDWMLRQERRVASAERGREFRDARVQDGLDRPLDFFAR